MAALKKLTAPDPDPESDSDLSEVEEGVTAMLLRTLPMKTKQNTGEKKPEEDKRPNTRARQAKNKKA